MHRPRLLLVVPAATALVFTGLAPAAADEGGGHHGDDAWARVVSIDEEAEATKDAAEVTVEFDYMCEGEDITATVVLEQDHGDVRYEAELEEGDDLTCDGDKRTAEATLEPVKDSEDVENGEAEVTVTFEDEDGEELDSLTADVEVEGAEDGGGHDGENQRDEGHGEH
jgi:hypothetical protein